MSATPILRATGIGKLYPGTVALDGVDFEVVGGAVNVLIGENGAGKSTLVKILAGVETATTGRIELDGREIRLRSTRDADRAGIGIIYQELSLFPNLSVTENIFMAREMRRAPALIDHNAQHQAARALMARLDQAIDVRAEVGSLPLGQQQIVEIARALARDVRVLMMDEPTSALSSGEIAALFRVIGELRASGVGIVYISHKLEELMEIGDRITVLRDGRKVAQADASGVDVAWIIEMMTGRKPGQTAAHTSAGGDDVLRVENIRVPGRVDGVSFIARAGQVTGIYGLMGAGRTELFEALAGARDDGAGRIFLKGERVDHLPLRARLARGMALVPEDRKRSGLVSTFSLLENVTLSSLAAHNRFGRLAAQQEAASTSGMVGKLRIRSSSVHQPITTLSGGNQQKAVIARCLLTRPAALLMDEPSRGVDVGARDEIFQILRQLASEGIAVVFTSSDMHEVLSLSDRVMVMARGRVTADKPRSEMTEREMAARACEKPEAAYAG